MAVKYFYKGKTWNGEKIHGYIVAQNEQEVLRKLKSKQIFVINLFTINRNSHMSLNSIIRKVSRNDLINFIKQFAAMIKSGVPVIEALQIIVPQTKNLKLKSAITSVIDEITAGNNLYESFAQQKDIFPKLFLGMIKAGEEAGNLEFVLEKTSVIMQKEEKLIRKVKTALIYPTILLTISFFVLYLLLTIVLPRFVSIFAESDVELPALTQLLIKSGEVLRDPLTIIIIVFMFTVILVFFWYSLVNSAKYDKYKLKLPIIGEIIMTAEIIRFARTLSLLLQSGIVLIDALHTTASVMKNDYYSKSLLEVQSSLASGGDFDQSIRNSELFFPMVEKMIAIGESSGRLESLLFDMAEYYEDHLSTKLYRITTLIEPMLILFMAVFVGAIVLSVVLPMVSIWQVI